MLLDRKSSWVDLVTGISVVLSLVFVGWQIHGTTKAVRGATLQGITDETLELNSQTDRGPLRFEQSAAIVGPNDYGAVVMQSGFSVYTVTDGVIDAGTFVPLTMPRQ